MSVENYTAKYQMILEDAQKELGNSLRSLNGDDFAFISNRVNQLMRSEEFKVCPNEYLNFKIAFCAHEIKKGEARSWESTALQLVKTFYEKIKVIPQDELIQF